MRLGRTIHLRTAVWPICSLVTSGRASGAHRRLATGAAAGLRTWSVAPAGCRIWLRTPLPAPNRIVNVVADLSPINGIADRRVLLGELLVSEHSPALHEANINFFDPYKGE